MVGEVTGSLGNTSSTANVASQKLSADYESFLKLLTAQLQNQDPLEPMDSSTFVSQLAQLSQVEQSIQTNSHLESIAAKLNTAGLTNDLGLIGRQVSVPGNEFDVVGGRGSFDYMLEQEVASVSAVIRDRSGTLLRQLEGLSTEVGALKSVTWDGLDYEGLTVPDGTYQVEITAFDGDGTEVPVAPYMLATVDRLTLSGGLAQLHLSNGETALSTDILAVQ